MLKTSLERPGKPAVFLVVLGVLEAYLARPLLFLIGTAITLGRFKRKIPKSFPPEFVDMVALPTWLYMRLRDRLGAEKAFEVCRAALTTAGLAVQYGNLRAVEAPHSFENLVAFQQRTNREGPTRWNQLEIQEQTSHKYAFRVRSCMFRDFFAALGVPELTQVFCSVDNAIFNVYLPDEVTFHRNAPGRTLAEGAEACQFVIERHERQTPPSA